MQTLICNSLLILNGASLVAQMIKESTCIAGDLDSVPESGRSPGAENDFPLQYFCLENSVDRKAGWATVHGVIKSQTQLSN